MGRETLLDVRDGPWDTRGGPGRVGENSVRSLTDWGILGEV